ncbi:MAG: hypothetical protein IPK88_12525 [Saprospiraceae bacterium]|nr:hypothetical protein [Candidatus Defluviibacterium haderslevense]
MDSLRFNELLNKYFDNTIQNEELEEFFNAINNNATYKAEFEMEVSIKNSVILFNRRNLVLKMENAKKQNSHRIYFIKVLSIAAMFAIVITIYFLNVSKLDNKLLFSDNVVYIDYNIRKLNTILFSKSLNSDSLLNSQVDYVDSISSKINSEPNRIKTFKNNGNTLDTIGNRFLESDYTHSTSFVKVFYNAKSFYKVIDDTLCIYLNNKNVNNVNKIVKTKSDSLIIYTNEKIYHIYR